MFFQFVGDFLECPTRVVLGNQAAMIVTGIALVAVETDFDHYGLGEHVVFSAPKVIDTTITALRLAWRSADCIAQDAQAAIPQLSIARIAA